MKQTSILRIGYHSKRYQISANDIANNTFTLFDNRRNIKKSTVNSIRMALENGIHFDSPIIVSERDGTWHILDGNHRYEAIQKYIAANPKNKVEVSLHIYSNLTSEQEKELFKKWNLGTKQSTNDIVKQFEEDIDILNNNRFTSPVNVYGGSGKVAFYRLVGTYLACTAKTFSGGYIGKPEKFVEDAQDLGQSDVTMMNAFMKDFEQIFGPLKNCTWLRTTPFVAIMKLWMDNHKHINQPKMISLMRSKIKNDNLADQLASNSGMGGAKFAYEKYRDMLNEGRSRDLFI